MLLGSGLQFITNSLLPVRCRRRVNLMPPNWSLSAWAESADRPLIARIIGAFTWTGTSEFNCCTKPRASVLRLATRTPRRGIRIAVRSAGRCSLFFAPFGMTLVCYRQTWIARAPYQVEAENAQREIGSGSLEGWRGSGST